MFSSDIMNGDTVRSSALRQRRGVGVGRTALLFFLALGVCACSKQSDKWNVLVLVPDTVRSDHLSVNGNPAKTTPALDQLAAEGANFPQTITVAPRTWQSFASILTGLYPPHHGIRFIGAYSLASEIPTIATELKAAGYVTKSFDRIQFIRKITGEHGFDETYDVMTFGDQQLAEIVWGWISEKRSEPFFAFVRLNGPHWPYGASAEEMEPFDSCDGHDHSFNGHGFKSLGVSPAQRGLGMRLMNKEAYLKTFFDVSFSDEERRHRIAHYDAKLRRTDKTIGWLIDQLRSSGLLEKTIVVVTSDHGESFGENGYLQHGPKVDEPVLLVPLIIRLPSRHAASRPGTKIEGQVRITDIFPTVLDAAGVSIPANLDGISLIPAIRGELLPETWAYAETGKDFVGASPEVFVEGVKGKQRMIRYAGWKLVYVPKPEMSEYQLFDLRSDRQEKADVAARFPEKVKELRLLLESVMDSDLDDASRERTLTDAEKEQLHQLGYM
jgi:arylsulfatase A-like enzyme